MTTVPQTAVAVASAFAHGEDVLMTDILLELSHTDLVLVAAQLAGFYVKTAGAHAASIGLPEDEYVGALLQVLGLDLAEAIP